MKTFNVKTVSAMLGKSQYIVMERARRLGLRTVSEGNQKWNFTEKDIERIKYIDHRFKKNRLRDIVNATGLTKATVSKLYLYCGLKLIKDYDKVLWACQKYATGFYTKEGIFYLLKTEYK
jgi:hypothetical protein